MVRCALGRHDAKASAECFSDACQVLNCVVIPHSVAVASDNHLSSPTMMMKNIHYENDLMIEQQRITEGSNAIETSFNRSGILLLIKFIALLFLFLVCKRGKLSVVVSRNNRATKNGKNFLGALCRKIHIVSFMLLLYHVINIYHGGHKIMTMVPYLNFASRETLQDDVTNKQRILNHFELTKEQHDMRCIEDSIDNRTNDSDPSMSSWPYFIEQEDKKQIDPGSTSENEKIKFLALYFPQWYPARENNMKDDWRYFENDNFTHNYRGHPISRPQNNLYYNPRCIGMRETQAALANKYLIDGFVYYFYWFEDRMFLPEVNQRMLQDGQPDTDFCFMWVNEDFKRYKIKYDLERVGLMVDAMIPFFRHPRYIHIGGRPVLYVYLGSQIPPEYMKLMEIRLLQHGIPKPYIVTSIQRHFTWENHRIDFADNYAEFPANIGNLWESYGYTQYNFTNSYHLGVNVHFDNTPRLSRGDPGKLPRRLSKSREFPSAAADPMEFRERCISRVKSWYHNNESREKIVLIFAWNEWSEQAALEPSDRHGYGYLEAIKACKQNVSFSLSN